MNQNKIVSSESSLTLPCYSPCLSHCLFFPQILRTVFEVVVLEDRGNMWSLSRAILSMILINEEVMTILLLLGSILVYCVVLE